MGSSQVLGLETLGSPGQGLTPEHRVGGGIWSHFFGQRVKLGPIDQEQNRVLDPSLVQDTPLEGAWVWNGGQQLGQMRTRLGRVRPASVPVCQSWRRPGASGPAGRVAGVGPTPITDP